MNEEKGKQPDVEEKAITGREENPPGREYKGTPIELESAMETESDEDIETVEDEFAGEMTEQRARQLLKETETSE